MGNNNINGINSLDILSSCSLQNNLKLNKSKNIIKNSDNKI
jgi:hypothetical protein